MLFFTKRYSAQAQQLLFASLFSQNHFHESTNTSLFILFLPHFQGLIFQRNNVQGYNMKQIELTISLSSSDASDYSSESNPTGSVSV
jgi:hypothetical protein